MVAAHRSLLGVAVALVGGVVGAAAVLFNLAIRAWTWVSTGFDEYTTHIGQSHGVWGGHLGSFFSSPPLSLASSTDR